MTSFRLVTLICPLGLLTSLTACDLANTPDYVTPCMFEVNAPGHYGYPAGVAVPTVIPASDATQEGADAINACIRDRAAAAQSTAPASQQTMTTQASDGVVTRTFTLGTPPAPAQSTAAEPASTAVPSTSPAQCRLEMTGGSGYSCVP